MRAIGSQWQHIVVDDFMPTNQNGSFRHLVMIRGRLDQRGGKLHIFLFHQTRARLSYKTKSCQAL